MNSPRVQTESDMSDAEMWKAHHAESQAKREGNRNYGAQQLTAKGIAFESKNGGAHLIVRHAGRVLDFWPGTGRWIQRGTEAKHRGVASLIRFVKATRPDDEMRKP